ncbi:hypothetical protein [Nocardia africana]|uniref:Uncharacterized protein n=1 Tax=Nocardia africana TaxID=134964 RepID=A0ABW6NS44_9NOCA
MTHGQDPVMQSNGRPVHSGTAPVSESAHPETPQIEVRAETTPVGRMSGLRGLRRTRTGMRPSTLALITVWIVVLALYLAVRPGG